MRKTFTYKLRPTPQQEQELGRILGSCSWLYNTALEQRIIAHRRAGVLLSCYQQQAELNAIREASLSPQPSIATCYKPCWRGSTRLARRSFAA
jgi:hypothetical protein